MTSTCERCHRGLKDPVSVRAGMGPVCRAKAGSGDSDMDTPDQNDVCDLPFDPQTTDIVCRRETFPGPLGELRRLHFNIPQAIVSHSPSGMEWGYGGSGPSDFALNILHLFLPPLGPIPEDCEDVERLVNEDVKCYRGVVSKKAYQLHQPFKTRFIATLPKEGGTIRGDDIRAWIPRALEVDKAGL